MNKATSLLEQVTGRKLARREKNNNYVAIVTVDAMRDVIWEGDAAALKGLGPQELRSRLAGRRDYAGCTDVAAAFRKAADRLAGASGPVHKYLFVFSDLIGELPTVGPSTCQPVKRPSLPPASMPWDALQDASVTAFWVPIAQKHAWNARLEQLGLAATFKIYTVRGVNYFCRYLKDPDSGRRVSRLNPPSEWVIQAVPELRIVDQDLWAEAKARQRQMRQVSSSGNPARVNHARRPRFLFSGLARCGTCGGGYVVYWRERLAWARGTCTNRLTIERQELEGRVLAALRDKLMRRDLFEEFCKEYVRELNRLRMEHRAKLSYSKRELATVEREIRALVQAIKEGVSAVAVKDELQKLESRQAERLLRLDAPEMPELLHPRIAHVYRDKVTRLCEALQEEASRAGAVDAIRGFGTPSSSSRTGITQSAAEGQPDRDAWGRLWTARGRQKPATSLSSRCGGGIGNAAPSIHQRRGCRQAGSNPAPEMEKAASYCSCGRYVVAGARKKLYRQLCWAAA